MQNVMIVIIIACSVVSLLVVVAHASCAALAIWAIVKRRRKVSDSRETDHHIYENSCSYSNAASCTEVGVLQNTPPEELAEHMYDYVESDLDFEVAVGRERINTKPNAAYGHLNH